MRGDYPAQLPDNKVPLAELKLLGGYTLTCWTLKQQHHPAFAAQEHEHLLSLRLLNSLRHRENKRVIAAFANAGIDYRLLKGCCAWLHVYTGREEIRPVSDTDILVNPKDFQRAACILASIDYRSAIELDRLQLERTINQASFSRKLGRFENTVDLHRNPHNWPLHHRLGALAMSPQHCCTVQSFKTLSKPATVVWIACHRAKDRYQGDVRELLDVRLIINSMSDTELNQTVAAVHELELQAFTLRLLYQSIEWYGPSDKQSQESHLMLALQQTYPRVARLARRRVAGVQPSTGTSTIGNLAPRGRWYSNPVQLFSQYLESLLTRGHSSEAIISMASHLLTKIRVRAILLRRQVFAGLYGP